MDDIFKMPESKPYCSDRDHLESVATGVVAGLFAAGIIKALGLTNTIVLGIVAYVCIKHWDKITMFFGWN